MDPEYLSILMCPKTRGALRLASADEVALVNQQRRASDPDAEPWDAALVCDEGGLVYPVRDGIPVLLADAAIPFRSASDNPTSS